MNCTRSDEMMSKYYDGDCNDIEKLQLKHHLKECPECSQNFENLKEVFSMLQENNTIEPPEDYEASIMHKITALELARKKNIELTLMILFWATSVVAIALMLLVFLAMKDRILSWIAPLGLGLGAEAIVGHATQMLRRMTELGTETFIQLSIIGFNLYKDVILVASLILMLLTLQQGRMMGAFSVIGKGAVRKD